MCLLTLQGCGTIGFGGSGRNQLSSEINGIVLTPTFGTMVYAEPIGYDELPDRHNEQIVDVYLTDLPHEILTAFASDGNMADLPGDFQLVHLHMFVRPHAGRTPIEPTSINTAVRYLIAAGGRAGLYTGGGFVLPGGEPDGDDFRGRMSQGALRLASSSTGFVDRLGSAKAELAFDARFDDDAATGAQRLLDRMLERTEPVMVADVAGG